MPGNNRMASIVPERIGADSRFKFECHKEVGCFTKCCRGINIILTPYDIIRLKNRLGISSEEFLAIYTKPRLLEKTDLPVVTLKLMDDDESSCPFVRDDGCLVYPIIAPYRYCKRWCWFGTKNLGQYHDVGKFRDPGVFIYQVCPKATHGFLTVHP